MSARRIAAGALPWSLLIYLAPPWCLAQQPRLADGPIRGGYLDVRDTALAEPAARSGLNTLLVKFPRLRPPPDTRAQEQIEYWSGQCRRLGLDLWVCFHVLGAHETGWLSEYRRYVDKTGRLQSHTPCPADPGFWRESVYNRLMGLAQLSRQYPITGVILDLEMYAADFSIYYDVCYCGECVARTLRAAGRDVSPPYPDSRAEWLTGLGLLEVHRQQVHEAVRRLAEQARAAVEQVAPDLRLGGLCLDLKTPVVEAMLAGLGREGHPAYAFSESTYHAGYDPQVDRIKQRIRDLKANAVLVCGLWQNKFTPAALSAHLYFCARNSGGYWIYTLEDFGAGRQWSLPAPPEQYWAAYRQANDELDRLAADPSYQTSLKIEPFVLPPTPLTTAGVKRFHLRPWLEPTDQPVPPVQLRKQNTLYFYARAGQRVRLSLTLIQFGPYHDGGQYLLVPPVGQAELRGDLLETGRAVELEYRAKQTGVHALVLGSGDNAIRVEGRQPYAIAAEPDAPARFLIVIPTLYVLARPGQRHVILKLETPGEGERVKAVISTGGKVCHELIVPGPQTALIPIEPTSEDRVVEIQIFRVPGVVMEDFSIAVLDGAYPLVAPTREGLLSAGQ